MSLLQVLCLRRWFYLYHDGVPLLSESVSFLLYFFKQMRVSAIVSEVGEGCGNTHLFWSSVEAELWCWDVKEIVADPWTKKEKFSSMGIVIVFDTFFFGFALLRVSLGYKPEYYASVHSTHWRLKLWPHISNLPLFLSFWRRSARFCSFSFNKFSCHQRPWTIIVSFLPVKLNLTRESNSPLVPWPQFKSFWVLNQGGKVYLLVIVPLHIHHLLYKNNLLVLLIIFNHLRPNPPSIASHLDWKAPGLLVLIFNI